MAWLGLVVLRPEPTYAGNLQVTPVLVELSEHAQSALVSLRNDSTERMRYEVTVFSWSQSRTGNMKLEPSKDLIFFPALLTLSPGEERKLRIGTTGKPFGEIERSYRLFVEELPPPSKKEATTRVRVLTRIGIPIFLEPKVPAARGELAEPKLDGDHFTFRLRNTGNVRLRPLSVQVAARGSQGELISEQMLDAWYVLAGEERLFDAPIDKKRCAEVRKISAKATLEDGVLQTEIPVPRGACGS